MQTNLPSAAPPHRAAKAASADNSAPVPSTFTDLEGRSWKIQLNYGLIRQVLKTTGVDLLKLFEDAEHLQRLAGDDETMLAVLWLLVADQAAAQSIEEAAFWCGFDDDVLYSAFNAVLGGLIGFFRPDKRAPLKKIYEVFVAANQRMAAMATEKASDPRIAKLIEQTIQAEDQRIDSELTRLTKLIWRCAGYVGLSPDPWTFWQLIEMADGRGRKEWEQTAAVVCIIANAHRKRRQPWRVSDFNPFSKHDAPATSGLPIRRGNIRVLKTLFVDRK